MWFRCQFGQGLYVRFDHYSIDLLWNCKRIRTMIICINRQSYTSHWRVTPSQHLKTSSQRPVSCWLLQLQDICHSRLHQDLIIRLSISQQPVLHELMLGFSAIRSEEFLFLFVFLLHLLFSVFMHSFIFITGTYHLWKKWCWDFQHLVWQCHQDELDTTVSYL